MKRFLIIAFIFLAFISQAAAWDTPVRGHVRRDGTYVQPHHRTNPDNNIYNNYSTQGNVNPYTGQIGTVNPYQQQLPSPFGQQQQHRQRSILGD